MFSSPYRVEPSTPCPVAKREHTARQTARDGVGTWGPPLTIGTARLPKPGAVPVARAIRYVIVSGVTLYSDSCLVDAAPDDWMITNYKLTIREFVNCILSPA